MLELNLPADADSARVLDRLDYLCRTIDPADLAEGESVDPRLQLLPSLGHADPEGVAALLGGLPPVGLVLGAVRSYRGPDGDTLAVPVESDGLFRIHKHLARHLPGSAEGDYDPRIVLCKVRRGRGAAYDGDDALEGAALTVSEATLPGPGGPRTVRLDGPDPAAARVAKKHAPPRPQAPTPAPVAARPAPAAPARTPAREPVTLQAAWKSLTPVARDDLRRLRDRGTDGAMRKAFRLVGQAARDGESRGLLLDWLAKKWLHSPTQRSQNRYVLDSDPQKVRYFKTPPKGAQGPGQGDQPGGGKQDAQQEAPAAPAQQQGQGEQPAPQQEKPAAKPAKAPAKGKTPRTDPAQAQQELGAMLADPSTADAGRARDILLGLTVAQARQVAEKLGVDLTGARSGGKADVAQKLASRLASKALEGTLASHEGALDLGDQPTEQEAPAPQQAPAPPPPPAAAQQQAPPTAPAPAAPAPQQARKPKAPPPPPPEDDFDDEAGFDLGDPGAGADDGPAPEEGGAGADFDDLLGRSVEAGDGASARGLVDGSTAGYLRGAMDLHRAGRLKEKPFSELAYLASNKISRSNFPDDDSWRAAQSAAAEMLDSYSPEEAREALGGKLPPNVFQDRHGEPPYITPAAAKAMPAYADFLSRKLGIRPKGEAPAQQQQAPAQQAAPAPAPAPAPARAPQKAPAPRRAARPASGDPLGGRAPATRKPSSERNVDASGGDATYDPTEMGDDGEVAAEFLAGERARANGGEAGKQMDLRQGVRITDAPGSSDIDRIRQSAATLRDITGGKVGRDGAARFLAEVERSSSKGGLLTAAKSAGVKANQSMSLPALKRAIQSHVAASLAEHHPPERPARRRPGEWRRLAAARQQALGNIDPVRRRALDVADEGDEPAPRPAPAPARAPSREDRVAALERREREREAGQPRAKRRGAAKE